MSTSTEQEFVTVPFDNTMLQKLFIAQLAMQKQQAQAQAQALGQNKPETQAPKINNNQGSLPKIQPKTGQVKPATAPSWGQLNNQIKTQPQNGQVKLNVNPQGQGKPQLKMVNQTFMAKKEVVEEKKEQPQGGNGLNNQSLALFGQIAQMAAAGGANPGQVALLTNLLNQIGGQNNNNNNNNNQGGNDDNNDGGRPFKYSSMGNQLRGGQDGGFNNRNNNRNFQNNRGPRDFSNNRGGNNFRGGRGHDDGGNFRGGRGGRGGRNNDGGNFRGRRQFGDQGGDRRGGNRDGDDFSRSRSRDKSAGFGQNNRRFNNDQEGGNDENQDFSKNRSGPRPVNSRPGDWDCPQCNNLNYATRRQCNRCGIDKPQELIDQEEEKRGNGPVFKKGDWYCPDCKNLNFAKRVGCNRCGAGRPEETMEDFKPSMKNSARNENNFDDQEPGEMMGGNHMEEKQEAGGHDDVEEGEVGAW